MDRQPILKLIAISKSFPGVQALEDVSLDIMPGEVHVLMGENGAGKSTLIKIISGVYQCDKGEILLEGNSVIMTSPRESRQKGISTVYQELSLADDLSVAENIFMGRLPVSKKTGWVKWSQLFDQTKKLLKELEIDLNPRDIVTNLSVGYRQMIEIARAFSINAKIVIFDEPTAVLTVAESEKLFKNIQKLKARGVGIIYISHRMAEILNMADRITVLRDGKFVATLPGKGAKQDDIIKLMVGRNIEKGCYVSNKNALKAPILEVENLNQEGVIKDISFQLHPGEVLGFYGLVGAGRTELSRLIYGLEKPTSGAIKIEQKEVNIKNPQDAIQNGIGLVPEDRRHHGLVLILDIAKNINLANHSYISKAGFINSKLETKLANQGVRDLSIKTPSLHQKVENLSGGNQQKVIIARWLTHNPKPKILILDEPTRGVDVGAKAEIHRLIRQLTEEGIAVIVISSDMPEVLSVSDRILVMREGSIVGELTCEEASEEKVIFLAAQQLQ